MEPCEAPLRRTVVFEDVLSRSHGSSEKGRFHKRLLNRVRVYSSSTRHVTKQNPTVHWGSLIENWALGEVGLICESGIQTFGFCAVTAGRMLGFSGMRLQMSRRVAAEVQALAENAKRALGASAEGVGFRV